MSVWRYLFIFHDINCYQHYRVRRSQEPGLAGRSLIVVSAVIEVYRGEFDTLQHISTRLLHCSTASCPPPCLPPPRCSDHSGADDANLSFLLPGEDRDVRGGNNTIRSGHSDSTLSSWPLRQHWTFPPPNISGISCLSPPLENCIGQADIRHTTVQHEHQSQGSSI